MSVRKLLNEQPNTRIDTARRPFLPWDFDDGGEAAVRKIRKFFLTPEAEGLSIVGETSWFLIRHAEHILNAFPSARFICIRRDRDETIDSFSRWLDGYFPVETNLWASQPKASGHHDPILSPSVPKFDEPTVTQAIGRYWDAFYDEAKKLSDTHPDRVRMFEMGDALTQDATQRELLSFAGVPDDSHTVQLDIHEHQWTEENVPESPRQRRRLPADHPKKYVVLVPTHEQIPVACELALVELERRGYIVRRLPGFAAVDQARNVLATDAMVDGFEGTMWIDSDIEFNPDDVDRLRSHNLPIVSGVYAKKAQRAIASHLLPGTESFEFGQSGRLYEIMYAGTGFLYVRREVYERIQQDLRLPVCNELFDEQVIPFFMPLVHDTGDGPWYLAEDYAFSQRARQVGFTVMADTTIRLWHLGTYRFGWEDAGRSVDRYRTTKIVFSKDPHSRQKASEDSAEA